LLILQNVALSSLSDNDFAGHIFLAAPCIFAESKENTDAVAQLIGNGIKYQVYYF
jgi:hypothetical protein